MSVRAEARRLVAILTADVAGYSRLMGEDETRTPRALESSRAVMDGLIARFHGRIANTADDSVLAGFASVVDAVACAVEVQETRDGDTVPEERRLRVRIGVHVVDVLVRDSEIFGDAVNIASRLQALADPGRDSALRWRS